MEIYQRKYVTSSNFEMNNNMDGSLGTFNKWTDSQ